LLFIISPPPLKISVARHTTTFRRRVRDNLDGMKEIAADLRRWRERGDKQVALATVVATRQSAPRPVGSKLAVSEQGELAGSVSGGCVENEVYTEAREVLATGEPKLLSYAISDDEAWSVGLPCGGEIDVFVERLT
jgi:xanthine dehydrogenase accessory factor